MSKTILAVDDSKSIRQMVSMTLTKEGYTVIEAGDGKEAVTRMASANVNMIITDLNMPNMDGIELIRNVRKDPKYRFIPIIMLTTESSAEKKDEGKKAGATGWIVKPFQPAQLISVIQKVLR